MRKNIFISIIVVLIAISNLNAKTIWIKDLTDGHPSMVTFYNTLIEDLKLTQYKQYIETVTDNKQIKEQKGDIILEFSGMGNSTNTGNITYFYYIGCTVDNCDNWAYRITGSWIFSDEYIYEQARKARIDIVKFLDNWF